MSLNMFCEPNQNSSEEVTWKMKYRESGMPDEALWDTFFSPVKILQKLGVDKTVRTLADIGCGYGTFLIPAAGLIGGRAAGIDIDPKMIDACNKKIQEHHLKNIDLLCGDISMAQMRSRLSEDLGSVDYVTLFNILHCETPLALLHSACRLLSPCGRVGVIHWIDEKTPRGPSMAIRPTPEQIEDWAAQADLCLEKRVALPPYHFGLVFTRMKK